MSLKNLKNQLGINEKFTKVVQKQKEFNRFKDNVALAEDYNMMCDILHLPTTKEGYSKLFVILDIATDECDFEPIKDIEAETVLKAMKKCFSRKYVKKPEFTLVSDSGNEFKGVFAKYLYDESIYHKVAIGGRHQGVANVENLNKQLGRLLNGYMNKNEVETGKVFREWTDIIPLLRRELNKIRKKKMPENLNSFVYPTANDTKVVTEVTKDKKGNEKVVKYNVEVKAKFKVGDEVHRINEKPKNALGKIQPTFNFREGDFRFETKVREIKQVVLFDGEGPLYRYILEGLPQVSYAENELRKA